MLPLILVWERACPRTGFFSSFDRLCPDTRP